MDQPGKVANPARGQLNRENEHSPVPVVRSTRNLEQGMFTHGKEGSATHGTSSV